MQQKIIDVYNDHDLGLMGRRECLAKMAKLAGGTAAAYAMFSLLGNDYARAGLIPPDDARIKTETVNYPGATGDIRAYTAIPKAKMKVPGVLVVHEIWGLNPHIEDVTRRLAVENFLAIAPDALTPSGGTPEDPRKAFQMVRQLDPASTQNNYLAALKYLQNHPQSNGNVGVIGFCWGGGMANQLAVRSPDLKAAVPFYGRQAKAEDVPQIKASLLLHYAGNDQRINKGIPAYEEALKKAGTDYTLYMYEGANHAFHNDANPKRYNKEAAELAWKRTIQFLNEKLRI